MFIGAIEACSDGEISGWLHCRMANLSGETVLAYLDGTCIGSGTIEMFREDLLIAGLDDGRLGFRFAIAKLKQRDLRRVVVSLEGCEAVLLQRGVVLSHPAAESGAPSFVCGVLPSLARLEWLETHGLLRAGSAAMVLALADFGVASYKLDDEPITDRLKLVFESIELGTVNVRHFDLDSQQDISSALISTVAASSAGLFVVVADRSLTFHVQETEATDRSRKMNDEVVGAVEYVADERSALFIRRWTPFAVGQTLSAISVRCYYPVLEVAQNEICLTRG